MPSRPAPADPTATRTAPARPRVACLHRLFEAQATRSPDAVALSFEGAHVSYADLDSRADRLARALRALGVGPEVPVGLFVDRSIEVVVGILAILKAGGAYVPLDPAYPAERLAMILDDARAPLLLTQASLLDRLPEDAPRAVLIDDEDAIDRLPSEDEPDGGAVPSNLAYIIYTSGSTGRPKGVGVTHANAARLMTATEPWFLFNSDDVWTLFHSFAFDFSVWELWGALAYGGRLVIVPFWVGRSPEAFHALLVDERVTVLNQTPSAFRQLIRADEESDASPGLSLRLVIFGGEALELQSLAPWFARHGDQTPSLVNMYGITETTVHVTYRPIRSTDLAAHPGSSPIGRAIPDLRLHLLDGRMRPVPVGVVGEIHVGGAGVARGYLGRPALTAERFVPDPFARRPGARLYRSGDLARRRPDGELEYVGRADHQVKIRGFRIELGEIESALSAHPSVRESAVIARDDRGADDRRLVAYVVGRGERIEPAELRAWLAPKLPGYMMPSAFVGLDALPLTPHGKVDRDALPAPEANGPSSSPFEAPRTPVEEAIASAWMSLLGAARVGRDDHFFELGGHSLLAARVVSRLRESLGVAVPLRTLFEAPTVAGLASRIESLRIDGRWQAGDAIAPRPVGEPAPLSYAQQALWYLDRVAPDRPTFHVTATVRVLGPLDADALSRSFAELVARHESLRTTIADDDGRPVAVVWPTMDLPISQVDLRGLPGPDRLRETESIASVELRRPFDLARGPLARASLIRLGDEEHAVVLTMHHIITDGWSLGVAAAELSALYDTFRRGLPSPLAPLPIQFGDFARWQRDRMRDGGLERLTAFWRDRLADLPALELPTDRPRPPIRGDRGGLRTFDVPADVSESLRSLCRAEGVTPFMAVLAIYELLLSRYSGQRDFAVGTPVANRPRAEVEGLIGYFVNMLALRADTGGDPSFRALLSRVREASLSAFEHQELPFDVLVEAIKPLRDPSRTPIFQAMFVLQNTLMPDALPEGLSLEPLGVAEGTGTAKFDLSLGMVETDSGFSGSLEYAADLFDDSTAGRMADHLLRLLAQATSDPSRRLSEFVLADDRERDRVLRDWNATASVFPRDRCVHDLIADAALRTPEATALVAGQVSWTYDRLLTEADRVASALATLGIGPESRVGLFLDRGTALAAGLLGTLRAGAAYVPLDTAFPRDRVAFLIRDAGLSAILTRGEALRSRLPETAVPTLDLDSLPPRHPDGPRTADPENAAYVLYTSGTTGPPKGVVVPHRALVNHNLAAAGLFDLRADDRVLQFGSIAFDLAAEEFFPAWMSGAAVVLRGEEHLDARHFHRLLASDGITVADLPTAFWHAWVRSMTETGDAPPTCLRLVVVGGEEASSASLAAWKTIAGDRVRWINTYGPTEATIIATAHEPRGPTPGRIPIGRPIANVRAYVLDEAMRPQPVGLPGNLYLGGEGLARGYLGRPGLTAQAFVPDPFGLGDRLYRTGDRARWTPDGALEFLGRDDDQVKIRGHRVEPGEVESALRALPGVAEAAVLVRDGAGGEPSLAAYVVGSRTVDDLRRSLRDRLPRPMIPATIAVLDALPLTTTGKVDRRALAGLRVAGEVSGSAEPGGDDLERRLIAALEDLLDVRPIGREDDFFDLGGHSLLAVRLLAAIRRETGREVALTDLLRRPTAEGLASLLRDAETASKAPAWSPLVPIQSGPRDPLFCVHPAGGVAYGFMALARSLGEDQSVCGIRAAGLDGERAPLSRLDDLAESYIEAIRSARPRGPYHLAGWSLGGLVAFEMARRLIESGEQVGTLAMIDIGAPSREPFSIAKPLRARVAEVAGLDLFGGPPESPEDDAILLTSLASEMPGRWIGGLGRLVNRLSRLDLDERRDFVLRHFHLDRLYSRESRPKTAANLLRVLRANVLAGVRYRPARPYPGRILVFTAAARGRVDTTLGWGPLAEGGATGHVIPGDHTSILAEPGVAAMASILRAEMDRAGGDSR